MYQVDVFKNAMTTAQVPSTAPAPPESVLQALEKDLVSTMEKSKSEMQTQGQNGPGAPTPLQKKLRAEYGMTDNITYNNKIGDYSAQLGQTNKDPQGFTDSLLLSTMQSRDSLHLKSNLDSMDNAMLFGQAVDHISKKREKLGKKRPVLSHDVHF